jgi:hypothetical protein
MIRMRMTSFAAGAVLAAIAASPVSAQTFGFFPPAPQTTADVVRAWVSAVDATPEWTARIDSATDEGNDGVIIRGLSIGSETNAAFKVEVGALTIRGFAASGDGFTASAVEADQARVSAGPMTFTLTDAELAGLNVPSLSDIVLDPTRPFASMAKAYGVAARMKLDSGRVARLQLDQVNQGVASAVSYQNIVLGKLADGRLDQLTAGPVAMASPAPEGLVRFSIDRVESRGLDIAAMARAFDPDRHPNSAGDEEWRPALAYGAYRNVAIEALGLKATIGALSVENLGLRPPQNGSGALFDESTTNANVSPKEALRLATDRMLGFLSSMSAGQVGIRDLDIVGTGFSRFRVGAINLRDVSLDSIGEFRIDDVRIAAGEQASFDLGRFAIGRVVMPRVEAIRAVVEATLGGDNPDISSLAPQIGSVDIRGAKFATPESGVVGIDSFRLDLGSYVGQVPTVVELATSGISLDRRFLEGFPEARLLDELGYDRLAFNSSLKLDWQESASALRVQDFNLAIDKVGRMSADLDFGGLTREGLQAGAFDALTFGGGTIALTDDSAVDRVFEAQAARLKVEPATLKKRASDFVPALTKILANPFLRGQLVGVLPGPLATVVNALTPMLNDPGLSAQVVKALQGFIDAKGTITVSARPASPVPLGSLTEAIGKAPETLPSLLSVEVGQSP